MDDAYMNEKSNWSESNAFKVVAQEDFPQDANIIGSPAIQKHKADGSLKARIVPHGHMDHEKNLAYGCPYNFCRNTTLIHIISK